MKNGELKIANDRLTHTKNLKNSKAITLVALVITIVILLILAGISISALTNTGIFQKAKDAKSASENAERDEDTLISKYEKELNKYISNDLEENIGMKFDKNTELHDKNGNKIVVPKGFKIVVDEDTENAKTVEDGIVIEDATETSTKGSQFVWIPVGKIKKTDGTITEIKLDRYTFLEDGTPVEQGENVVEYFFKELNKSNGDNITAKNIDEFKNSVDLNGGYYIGRYETRKNKNGGITEVKSDVVLNDVTQIDAANYARNMYNDKNYTCDLINSYAWDTATLFLQSFGNNKTYSRKNSLNVETLEENGTIDDKQCNVFDMASNLMEWTTETFNGEETGVLRGGRYNDSYIYTGWRGHNKASVIYIGFGFRPILYLK